MCLGVEDLCLGCGETDQVRNGRTAKITKINSDHIQFCENPGSTVTDYIRDLRRMFPYIECDVGRPTMDYGEWKDAFINGSITSCGLGLPSTIKQRIPFGKGDVTNHNGCLWMSLKANNIEEPTKTDNNWLSICDLAKMMDCVICDAIDTPSVNLTKTKLPGIGNSIKGDVIIATARTIFLKRHLMDWSLLVILNLN